MATWPRLGVGEIPNVGAFGERGCVSTTIMGLCANSGQGSGRGDVVWCANHAGWGGKGRGQSVAIPLFAASFSPHMRHDCLWLFRDICFIVLVMVRFVQVIVVLHGCFLEIHAVHNHNSHTQIKSLAH